MSGLGKLPFPEQGEEQIVLFLIMGNEWGWTLLIRLPGALGLAGIS
jgi:hypothetical protein